MTDRQTDRKTDSETHSYMNEYSEMQVHPFVVLEKLCTHIDLHNYLSSSISFFSNVQFLYFHLLFFSSPPFTCSATFFHHLSLFYTKRKLFSRFTKNKDNLKIEKYHLQINAHRSILPVPINYGALLSK